MVESSGVFTCVGQVPNSKEEDLAHWKGTPHRRGLCLAGLSALSLHRHHDLGRTIYCAMIAW